MCLCCTRHWGNKTVKSDLIWKILNHSQKGKISMSKMQMNYCVTLV